MSSEQRRSIVAYEIGYFVSHSIMLALDARDRVQSFVFIIT